MARDEAITENYKYFRTALQIQGMTRSEDELRKMAAAQTDLYVALGMLKLDEPKSGMTVFCEEMNWPEGGMSYQILFRSLDKAGLKIVSK